jgi:glycosyltransferase involved in cell wall biosynthesis
MSNISIPILMITHNRLSYTKKAVEALMNVRHCLPFIYDNNSTDGTSEWLDSFNFRPRYPMIYFDHKNSGISGAMNMFLDRMSNYDVLGKCDNDTILPPDFVEKMLPYMRYADMIQAKHHIIKETDPEGWTGFTRNMKREHGLLYHHFIGGSGILFKRQYVDRLPETKKVLMPWREFQKQNPNLKKAFVPTVEIKLLDEHGYSDYPEYYKQTGRA